MAVSSRRPGRCYVALTSTHDKVGARRPGPTPNILAHAHTSLRLPDETPIRSRDCR